jgi:hypothetical protein
MRSILQFSKEELYNPFCKGFDIIHQAQFGTGNNTNTGAAATTPVALEKEKKKRKRKRRGRKARSTPTIVQPNRNNKNSHFANGLHLWVNPCLTILTEIEITIR